MVEPTIRVLVVEDNLEDFEILQHHFSRIKHRKYSLENAASLSKGLVLLRKKEHQAYLVDYQLGPDSGMEFLKEAVALRCEAPVILLTGFGDHEMDLKAMALGAADFLNKNKLDPDLLERSIRYALERRKAEEQRSRLAAIVETSNDAIFTLGMDGIILSWNPGAERIYGYSPGEIGGRSVEVLMGPGREEEFRRILASVGDGKAVSNFETSHRSKEGRNFMVSLTASPILDPAGKHSRVSVIVRGLGDNQRSDTIRRNLQLERDELLSRLQLQMERMPVACLLADQNFHFTYWNPAAERMFGFSFREVEGRHPDEVIVPPAARGQVAAVFQGAQKGEIPVQGSRNENLRKDGKVITCEWYNTPLIDPQGAFAGIMCMALDVTERMKAETTLERMASILQQTSDAVIVSDPQGNFVEWNQGAERIYGWRAEEVLGKPNKLLEPKDRQGEIQEVREELLREGGTKTYETLRRRKDGKVIDVSITVTPLRNEKNEFIGTSAIVRDITERRKADEVRSQLSAILEQTADAVVGTDLDRRIFSWNKGAERMFGYTLEEVLAQPASILAPSPEMDEVEALRQAALQGEQVPNFETVRRKKDGGVVDVSITLSAIRDSKGRIMGVSSIARDITERKKAEESLKRHEEQMRLAQKMDAIGRLAGGVAHDFNNLLSVIGGNAEFLLSSLAEKDPHREEAEEVQKAVRRGADLTKQLLVFSQKQVVQPQAVDLNQVGSETGKMLKRLIDATVDLKMIQDPSLKPVLADPGQVQQVILNLAINSRDAMPKGGTLIIETKQVTESDLLGEGRPTLPKGEYVRLSVTDTGTGMTPEVQKHVFEPFFTTKAGKGTGLGLATIYGIVNKWSGHIFLHSSLGLGTTFTLYFPSLNNAEASAPGPRQISLIPNGSETILLAEDEEPVRKVLVRTLQKHGYKVLDASNGIEAIQKAWAWKDPIDILVTDTVMPKMNGKELADELKKARPKVKVLFISGYPKEILSQQGVLSPGIKLLQKPFELEDLAREVRKILDEK